MTCTSIFHQQFKISNSLGTQSVFWYNWETSAMASGLLIVMNLRNHCADTYTFSLLIIVKVKPWWYVLGGKIDTTNRLFICWKISKEFTQLFLYFLYVVLSYVVCTLWRKHIHKQIKKGI